jgi:hypothetical protein
MSLAQHKRLVIHATCTRMDHQGVHADMHAIHTRTRVEADLFVRKRIAKEEFCEAADTHACSLTARNASTALHTQQHRQIDCCSLQPGGVAVARRSETIISWLSSRRRKNPRAGELIQHEECDIRCSRAKARTLRLRTRLWLHLALLCTDQPPLHRAPQPSPPVQRYPSRPRCDLLPIWHSVFGQGPRLLCCGLRACLRWCAVPANQSFRCLLSVKHTAGCLLWLVWLVRCMRPRRTPVLHHSSDRQHGCHFPPQP